MDEDDAEEVDGCTLDDDDAGGGEVHLLKSGFSLHVANGKYLTLC